MFNSVSIRLSLGVLSLLACSQIARGSAIVYCGCKDGLVVATDLREVDSRNMSVISDNRVKLARLDNHTLIGVTGVCTFDRSGARNTRELIFNGLEYISHNLRLTDSPLSSQLPEIRRVTHTAYMSLLDRLGACGQLRSILRTPSKAVFGVIVLRNSRSGSHPEVQIVQLIRLSDVDPGPHKIDTLSKNPSQTISMCPITLVK